MVRVSTLGPASPVGRHVRHVSTGRTGVVAQMPEDGWLSFGYVWVSFGRGQPEEIHASDLELLA